MQLEISTKNGYQAAFAVFISIVISYIFHLDRSYWSTLTAFLMITQTFGESIKRSLERISMTILGCIAGTLIYFSLKNSEISLIILILLVTFFINYYFTVTYSLSVFFVTLLVVFLFAILGQWNTNILEERIIETIIGAVIALISTAIVFPTFSTKKLSNEIPNFLQKLQISIDSTFSHLYDPNNTSRREKLLQAFNSMQLRVNHLRYENLFNLFSKQTFDSIIFNLRTLLHHVINAYDLANMLQGQLSLTLIQDDLKLLQNILSHNFSLLEQRMRSRIITSQFISMDNLRETVREKVKASLLKSGSEQEQWFQFYSLLYSIRKTNEIIGEILLETNKNSGN